MTTEQKQDLHRLKFAAATEKGELDLAEGYLRYEALRKLNTARYADLVSKSLAGVATFDELVDELVLENSK